MKRVGLFVLVLALYSPKVSAIEPKIGESVFAFYQSGEAYFAATVVEEDVGSKGVYRVVFDDGDVGLVAAVQMRPLEIKEGLKVLARWKDKKYYAGTVAKIVGRAVYVHYDDGEKGWASIATIAVK